MSKYFNETRKAEEWYARENPAKGRSVAEMLESAAEAELGNAKASEPQRTPAIQISPSPELTHVLNAKDGPPHEAMESYRALRTRLMRLQSTKKIVSVVVSSGAPGEGKTLTTLNLALCCAQLEGLSVLVIDGDLRSRGLSRLIGDPATPGLAEVLSGEVNLQDAILTTNSPNLRVLVAGSPKLSPPELFAGSNWKDVITSCSSDFKLVLIDSPPVAPLTDFELIASACDGVLTVVRAHTTQRETLHHISGQVDSQKLLGIVLNGTRNNARNHYYYGYHQANASQS